MYLTDGQVTYLAFRSIALIRFKCFHQIKKIGSSDMKATRKHESERGYEQKTRADAARPSEVGFLREARFATQLQAELINFDFITARKLKLS